MAPSSPKRPSKFIEALPHVDDEQDYSSAIATPTDELFNSIMNEMDQFENRQRQKSRERGGSHSSFESLPSANGSTRAPSFPVDRSRTVKEGRRRSINFTRSSMDKELSGRPRSGSNSGSGSDGENAGDKLARKFVGRLRALTGGKRDGELKGMPYPDR